MLEVVTCEVTINLNMFSHFMKDEVVSNLNSTFVVTIHWSRTTKENARIKK